MIFIDLFKGYGVFFVGNWLKMLHGGSLVKKKKIVIIIVSIIAIFAVVMIAIFNRGSKSTNSLLNKLEKSVNDALMGIKSTIAILNLSEIHYQFYQMMQ